MKSVWLGFLRGGMTIQNSQINCQRSQVQLRQWGLADEQRYLAFLLSFFDEQLFVTCWYQSL